mmetsp:Transcript_11144/g.22483  ORF Transcript_11144/g.22483 Transcript_11144/m.22483 type:complete len:95 (+) Transcript_11144:1529-1813(+)
MLSCTTTNDRRQRILSWLLRCHHRTAPLFPSAADEPHSCTLISTWVCEMESALPPRDRPLLAAERKASTASNSSPASVRAPSCVCDTEAEASWA